MHPVLPAPAAASPERMTGLILHGRSRGPSAFIGGHVSGGWTAAHAVVPKSGLQVKAVVLQRHGLHILHAGTTCYSFSPLHSPLYPPDTWVRLLGAGGWGDRHASQKALRRIQCASLVAVLVHAIDDAASPRSSTGSCTAGAAAARGLSGPQQDYTGAPPITTANHRHQRAQHQQQQQQ